MAGIKEECGVFGIYDLDGGNVVPSIYYGLTSAAQRTGIMWTGGFRYQRRERKCKISQGSWTGK